MRARTILSLVLGGILLYSIAGQAQESLVPVPVQCGLAVLPDPLPSTSVAWGDVGSWCLADFAGAVAQLPSGSWHSVIDEGTNTAIALPVPIATGPATPGALLPAGLLAAGLASVAECGGSGTATSGITATVAAALPATVTVAWDYAGDPPLPGCLSADWFDVEVDGAAPRLVVPSTARTASIALPRLGEHIVRVRAATNAGVASPWSTLTFTAIQAIPTKKPRPPGQPRIRSGG